MVGVRIGMVVMAVADTFSLLWWGCVALEELRSRLVPVVIFLLCSGAVMLVAVPLLSMSTQRPFPFRAMGSGVFAIMSTGLIAQLAALPSEFDASFNRALPVLKAGNYLDETDMRNARKILLAAALTYVAQSLAGLFNIWRWMTVFRR